MLVIGCDPSSKKLAFTVLNLRGEVVAQEAFEIAPKPPLAEKLLHAEEITHAFVRRWSADRSVTFVIERPIVHMGAGTAITLGQYNGAVLAGAQRAVVSRVLTVENPVWKKAVIGNGGAKKEQIEAWRVEHHGPVDHLPEKHRQDIIDSECIARWGLTQGG